MNVMLSTVILYIYILQGNDEYETSNSKRIKA